MSECIVEFAGLNCGSTLLCETCYRIMNNESIATRFDRTARRSFQGFRAEVNSLYRSLLKKLNEGESQDCPVRRCIRFHQQRWTITVAQHELSPTQGEHRRSKKQCANVYQLLPTLNYSLELLLYCRAEKLVGSMKYRSI
jgi:hypothetical protein